MTSPMPRSAALLIAAAATLTLAGCNRDKDKATTPPPAASAPAAPVTPADAGAPFVFNSDTPYAKTALTLPQGIKGQPDLHATLYAEAVKELRQFNEGAQGDLSEAGSEGLPTYEKSISFGDVFETGKLFSLSRTGSEYTGGAHPNPFFAGVIWDKALKRRVEPTALFRAGADTTALDRALCAAVNAEKRARDPKAATVALDGKDWACPRAAATPFVLVGGTTPGKAAGLLFLIGPYQVGPYSDGAYQVVVPQSAFRALLSPAYADEFAGEPVKAAVTPKAA